jgi:hypothetical protein
LQEQLDLLDKIDALSRAGIGEYISLLQIVVYRDQSSGKSSCLEAISGVPFPRKDTLCTRFATELVLCKSDKEYTVVNIVPLSKRPEEEREKLLEYRYTLRDFDKIATLIDGVKVAIGLDLYGTGFSTDIL